MDDRKQFLTTYFNVKYQNNKLSIDNYFIS